jgi:3-deoxy-D-manno-octulosonic-acid transferase
VRAFTEQLKRRFPHRAIVLSTFTHTGNLSARENPVVDKVFYLPLDLYWTARRALKIIEPAILIFVETEIWPNLLRQAHKKGIPTILLSGRVSEKGFRSYARFAWFFKRVFRLLNACGMQSEVDRQRIIRLGAVPKRVSISGNLKHVALSPDGSLTDRNDGRKQKDAFLWVVGSSHRGEEEIVCAAFKVLKERFPKLRMILAPRHPQRFAEVEKILVAGGFSFVKRSRAGDYRGDLQHDIMLLDTLGELEGLYAEGDLAFVGGSLVDAGGHNLLEPARFHKPVLFGPYTSNVASLAAKLKQNGGGFEVHGVDDLVREITALLSEPQKCRASGEKAYEVAAGDGSAIVNSLNIVGNYLAAPVVT